MTNVIKISKPLHDVLTAPDTELILDGSKEDLKEKFTSGGTYAYASFTETETPGPPVSQTYTHNLGYVPFVDAYVGYTLSGTYYWHKVPHYDWRHAGAGAGELYYAKAEITETTLKLIYEGYDTADTGDGQIYSGGGYNVTFKYFIYANETK